MLLGTRATVQTHFASDRFKIEVFDYQWDVGTEVYETHTNVSLRWRVEPFRLNLPGRIGKSGVGDFGQLIVLPPQLALVSDGPAVAAGGCRVVACQFDPGWLEDTTGLKSDAFRDSICMNLANHDIEQAMRRLWREIVRPGFASELLSEGLALSIAADLSRYLIGQRSADQPHGKLSQHQLDTVLELVADGGAPPTTAVLAAHLGMSETHFRRMFKATIGQTIHAFVEEARLTRAKTLLITTELPLKVISHRLGFSHPGAFSTAFSNITGHSPRAFRRLHCSQMHRARNRQLSR